MTSKRSLAVDACLGAASLTIAACGGYSGSPASGEASGQALSVYISLPFQGSSKARSNDMLMGAKIALEQSGNKAGAHNISLAASGKWDANATSSAARKALQDESTIACSSVYITHDKEVYGHEQMRSDRFAAVAALCTRGCVDLPSRRTVPCITLTDTPTRPREAGRNRPQSTGSTTRAETPPRRAGSRTGVR